MIRLLQRECAVLPLVLKRRWFDMIAAGEKKEEYRSFSAYWDVRLKNWDCKVSPYIAPVVEFRCGYSSAAPRMAFWVYGFPVAMMMPYELRYGARHPEWGEPEERHFVISLGGPVKIVKEYME